ncbi:MAG: hypothetical protein ABR583_09100 [Gaiellaceae bacterium]
MKKTTAPDVQASLAEKELPARVQEALGELVDVAREGLLALSVGVGLGVLAELMEEEVVEVVGVKGKHDRARVAVRHGHESGEVTVIERDGDRDIHERAYVRRGERGRHYVATGRAQVVEAPGQPRLVEKVGAVETRRRLQIRRQSRIARAANPAARPTPHRRPASRTLAVRVDHPNPRSRHPHA